MIPRLSRADLLRAGAISAPLAAFNSTGLKDSFRRAPEPAANDKSVTQLSFWGGWTGPDGGVMQRLVSRFNAENAAVQVALTLYNWDLIFDRWRAEFDGGSPPDLVGFHATEVVEFAASGMLREISQEAERFELREADFFPPPWRLCRMRGGLYAIPLDFHPLALYVNASAARRARLDLRKPPTTAAEVVEWAERLTAANQWGYAAPAGDVECFRQWYSMLYQFGGRFMDAGMRHCLADSAAGVQAYTFLRNLITRRRVAMPEEGSVDADFLAGRVLMYLQGPWYIKGLQQAGLDFVTAPAPRIGPKSAVWANSHVLGVVNTLDNARVDAAMRFIAWLDAHALDWAEAGQVPARNSARAQLHHTTIWPLLQPFAVQAPNIVYQPNVVVHTQLFAENLPTPTISATQAVMLGRQTPEEAVLSMTEQVNQILESAKAAEG